MKRLILIIIVIMVLVGFIGCSGTGESMDSAARDTHEYNIYTQPPVITTPKPTPPLIMESIPEALQEKEPYAEPEINNGSAYIKEYMSAVYYADNYFIRMAVPESRILSEQMYSLYPAALDIYKNNLYYCDDDWDEEGSTIYRVVLNTPRGTYRPVSDMLSAGYTGHGGTFLVADDTIFYLNTDRRL